MSVLNWVPLKAISTIHDRQIARHGGASGLRDLALLEMGAARAMNLASYSEADLFEITAAYAFGIAKAHAFVDGNKRTAFVSAITFMSLNGMSFRPEAAKGVQMMEDLASGDVSEAEFAQWIRDGASSLV